jgi:hypothetical protein
VLSPEAAQPLFAWAAERHAIYMRKVWVDGERAATAIGLERKMSSKMRAAWGVYPEDHWSPAHLSADPIFQQYKFCNVYRELDRVTVWIKEHIREPFADHPNLWFMLAIARYINWPPALAELLGTDGWPDHPDFRPENMTRILEARRALGEKVETGAYMIRAESDRNAAWYDWSKQRYVCEVVLGKLWAQRESWEHDWETGKLKTLGRVWEILQDKHYTGWGPFMAYQVVVDLRWTRYLVGAPDIQTWAAVGPGSRRGLNRLHGRSVDYALSQAQGLEEMLQLRELSLQPGALAPWMHPIDLSDIQNCLCETDKYLRVTLGEGRPRAQYKPFRSW